MSYLWNDRPGVAVVLVQGIGSYEGYLAKAFAVEDPEAEAAEKGPDADAPEADADPIADARVSLADGAEGDAITADRLVVELGGRTLGPEDCSVELDEVQAGEGTIVVARVEGRGAYAGACAAVFA